MVNRYISWPGSWRRRCQGRSACRHDQSHTGKCILKIKFRKLIHSVLFNLDEFIFVLLQEAGIPIDMVGGVSIGAFMGGLWCMERNMTTMTQKARHWAIVRENSYLHFIEIRIVGSRLILSEKFILNYWWRTLKLLENDTVLLVDHHKHIS